MKRLIKKAANQAVYHATSMESFFSIVNSGELRPQETQASDWAKPENVDRYFDGDEELYNRHMSNYVGYTFFATDQSTAQSYGTRAASKSNFSNMYVIIKAELPEEVLMPDLNDMPEATTWQESSNSIGQVSVLGNVTTDQITGIVITLTDIHVVIETTVENWKVDVKKETAKQVRGGYLDDEDCYDLWDKLEIPHRGRD